MDDISHCGLGLVWCEILEQEGYTCLADLAAATDEELLAIRGMGPMKLRAIRRAAPRVEQLPLEEEEGPDALSALPY